MTESELLQFAEGIADFRNEEYYGGREATVQAVLKELREQGYEDAQPGFAIKEPWYKRQQWVPGRGWRTL